MGKTDDKAKIRRLAAKVAALTRANKLLKDKLRRGVEVCSVCSRDLTSRAAVYGHGKIWCTTCYRKKCEKELNDEQETSEVC